MYGGMDPSASFEKPSGCVVLDAKGNYIQSLHCKSDTEILSFFEPFHLHAIGIDAPKGLPLKMGLCCLETPAICDCPTNASRLCERLMRERGFSLFPVTKHTFPAAKAWIRRGLLLFLRFQGLGIPTFEVYPTGAKKILFPQVKFPSPKSKIASRILLQTSLAALIPNLPEPNPKPFSDHVLDALLAAYTVFLFVEKERGELVGDAREGEILIPTTEKKQR
ncbi:MAG: DUF429 domain-containing protein [Candidatus Omnitrophota bacterium]|nr:MAG: DUF429 domain-containing protein [Candidatus Omnitrophota bacterium]